MTNILKYIVVFMVMTLVIACSGNTAHGDTSGTYDTYHNDRYDYTVDYPSFLIPQGEADSADGQKFFSKDQKIQMLVYYQWKDDFTTEGENLPIREAYNEDLSYKEGVISSTLEKNHYIIESKVGNTLQTHYVLFEDNYFNIYFEYPESDKARMKSVIEHIIQSFKVDVFPDNTVTAMEEGEISTDAADKFPDFLEGFLHDNYWHNNINRLLRSKDKNLANAIDSKMDVRRYYARGTITQLATREEDFGFAAEDDFSTRPSVTGELIFEYINDDSDPCALIFSESDSDIYVIYYKSIESVPDVVVNNETLEIQPVKTAYPEAHIMAVYLPDADNNPRGFYFFETPDGWKLAFIDDSFCGA